MNAPNYWMPSICLVCSLFTTLLILCFLLCQQRFLLTIDCYKTHFNDWHENHERANPQPRFDGDETSHFFEYRHKMHLRNNKNKQNRPHLFNFPTLHIRKAQSNIATKPHTTMLLVITHMRSTTRVNIKLGCVSSILCIQTATHSEEKKRMRRKKTSE